MLITNQRWKWIIEIRIPVRPELEKTEMGPIFGPSYISGASLGDNSASWASYPRTRIYDADNILLYTKYAYLGC